MRLRIGDIAPTCRSSQHRTCRTCNQTEEHCIRSINCRNAESRPLAGRGTCWALACRHTLYRCSLGNIGAMSHHHGMHSWSGTQRSEERRRQIRCLASKAHRRCTLPKELDSCLASAPHTKEEYLGGALGDEASLHNRNQADRLHKPAIMENGLATESRRLRLKVESLPFRIVIPCART